MVRPVVTGSNPSPSIAGTVSLILESAGAVNFSHVVVMSERSNRNCEKPARGSSDSSVAPNCCRVTSDAPVMSVASSIRSFAGEMVGTPETSIEVIPRDENA